MERVIGKFNVDAVKQVHWNKDIRIVELSAVCNDGTPENERFHKYTPSGSITMTIDNPSAAAFFELGKKVYVTFQTKFEKDPILPVPEVSVG